MQIYLPYFIRTSYISLLTANKDYRRWLSEAEEAARKGDQTWQAVQRKDEHMRMDPDEL